MAHPFFDQITYPWSRDDARRLHLALPQAIGAENAIRQILQIVISDDTGLEGGAPKDMWRDALNLMACAGALRELCEYLRQDGRVQGNAAFQQLVTDVLDARSVTTERMLKPTVLLLDRTNLRDQVDKLAAQDSALRVVIVRGGTKTGKSHGRHLFEAAAKESQAQPVYIFSGIVSKVADVIQEIFGVFGAEDRIPQNFTTEPAYYRAVCRRLQQVADANKKRVWLAIDDLGVDAEGTPLLDREIRVFCEMLVAYANTPQFGDWFRIMLIQYPENREFPTRWGEDVWIEDRTHENDVRQEHVEELLTSWVAANGPWLSAPNVQALAADVIAKADVRSPPGSIPVPRLKRLHNELLETLHKLKEQRQS
jgi:hypothetical protein